MTCDDGCILHLPSWGVSSLDLAHPSGWVTFGAAMRDFEKVADEIWNGNAATIAGLRKLAMDEIRQVRIAVRNKYRADLRLTASPAEIQYALAKARAR